MDAHEDLPELVGELGEALVRSLTEDPECRALAHRVRLLGFNLTLSLEAAPMGSPIEEDPAWSEEDKKMMKSFRISLD